MLSVGLTFESALDARKHAGLVGPNSVIQLGESLRAAPGRVGAAEQVFASAGLLRLLHTPPDGMIDEAIPACLFQALWRELDSDQAARIARDAGRRTGDYVLTNRIPRVARVVLRRLPMRIAARLLLRAIRRNAWTFSGSGTCHVTLGRLAIVTIDENPLVMPGCVWHIGVLECLFRALISEGTRVQHSECHVDGVAVCRFEVDYLAGLRRPE